MVLWLLLMTLPDGKSFTFHYPTEKACYSALANYRATNKLQTFQCKKELFSGNF